MTQDGQKMDTTTQMTLRTSSHISEDLDIMASIHGLSPTGAVRAGLQLLLMVYSDLGEDGFLRFDPAYHAVTLRVEPGPESTDTSEPREEHLCYLSEQDVLAVDILAGNLQLVPQDVLRHAIHTARTVQEQTLMGGAMVSYGAISPATI